MQGDKAIQAGTRRNVVAGDGSGDRDREDCPADLPRITARTFYRWRQEFGVLKPN